LLGVDTGEELMKADADRRAERVESEDKVANAEKEVLPEEEEEEDSDREGRMEEVAEAAPVIDLVEVGDWSRVAVTELVLLLEGTALEVAQDVSMAEDEELPDCVTLTIMELLEEGQVDSVTLRIADDVAQLVAVADAEEDTLMVTDDTAEKVEDAVTTLDVEIKADIVAETLMLPEVVSVAKAVRLCLAVCVPAADALVVPESALSAVLEPVAEGVMVVEGGRLEEAHGQGDEVKDGEPEAELEALWSAVALGVAEAEPVGESVGEAVAVSVGVVLCEGAPLLLAVVAGVVEPELAADPVLVAVDVDTDETVMVTVETAEPVAGAV
jgi:hypothetical protein